MSHQPFETYIFSEVLLDDEQQHSLDRHLKDCERCSALAYALAGLDTVLSDSASPMPAPGFTQRWQAGLATHQLARQTRNLWLMTIGLFVLAGLMILTMITFNLSNLNWSYELTQTIARFSVFAAQVRQFSQIIGKLTNSSPFLLPILAVFGVGIFSSILMLIITWFGTIIRLYSPIYQKGNVS